MILVRKWYHAMVIQTCYVGMVVSLSQPYWKHLGFLIDWRQSLVQQDTPVSPLSRPVALHKSGAFSKEATPNANASKRRSFDNLISKILPRSPKTVVVQGGAPIPSLQQESSKPEINKQSECPFAAIQVRIKSGCVPALPKNWLLCGSWALWLLMP